MRRWYSSIGVRHANIRPRWTMGRAHSVAEPPNACCVVNPPKGAIRVHLPRHDEDSAAKAPRRPAVELIDAVVANMRQNLEQLKYSTLAPSRYVVYLHPAEYQRLEGILPIVRQQTVRALVEALQQLNRRPRWRRYTADLLTGESPRVENAADWYVEFVCDADSEIEEGGLVIDSELLLPADPELGIGERTRRVTTSTTPEGMTTRERTENRPTEPFRVFARLVYEDDTGPHSLDMARESITIGRGGLAYPVDVRIVSSADVSREHAKIRRDPATGQFFLIDLSSLGTTVNGRHVPRGYDEVAGERHENGKETPLPDRARLGLAEVVYLDFETVR
jgi:pSer/pThr/pTyr-binding forkhead associated (FHA) protein